MRGGDVQQAGIVGDRDVGRRQRQDGVAQVGAGEIARRRAGGGRRSRRRARFSPGPPSTQTAKPSADEAPGRARRNSPPASACAGRPRRARTRRPARPSRRARAAARQAATSGGGHLELAAAAIRPAAPRPSAAPGRRSGRSCAAARCSPQRRSLSRPKRDFADEAGALRDAGEQRRQRRLPGARHDQGVAVAFARAAAPASARCWAKARRLRGRSHDDALAHARHVVEQRRDHSAWSARRPGGCGKRALQQLDHRVAAHEIADPHVGHEQDRASGPPAGSDAIHYECNVHFV